MRKIPGALWNAFRRRLLVRLSVYCIVMGVVLLMLGYCVMGMPGKSYRGPLPPATAEQAALRDRLSAHVHVLAGDIGARGYRTKSSFDAAADYVEKCFRETKCRVSREAYVADNKTFWNIVAELPGENKAGEIIVIGAHYDTVHGTPGADDNASGVAGVLELARELSTRPHERTLRFVAFANEEPPYFQTDDMGSRVYSRACRARGDNILAMLALECIGCYSPTPRTQSYPPPLGLIYPSAGDFIGFVGNIASRSLTRRCVGAFRATAKFPSEGAAVPEWTIFGGLSDNWAFWKEGYQAVMVTDTAMFRNRNYHEESDLPDTLDYDRMARVVAGLVGVVSSRVMV